MCSFGFLSVPCRFGVCYKFNSKRRKNDDDDDNGDNDSVDDFRGWDSLSLDIPPQLTLSLSPSPSSLYVFFSLSLHAQFLRCTMCIVDVPPTRIRIIAYNHLSSFSRPLPPPPWMLQKGSSCESNKINNAECRFVSVHFTYDADGAGVNRKITNLLTFPRGPHVQKNP